MAGTSAVEDKITGKSADHERMAGKDNNGFNFVEVDLSSEEVDGRKKVQNQESDVELNTKKEFKVSEI